MYKKKKSGSLSAMLLAVLLILLTASAVIYLIAFRKSPEHGEAETGGDHGIESSEPDHSSATEAETVIDEPLRSISGSAVFLKLGDKSYPSKAPELYRAASAAMLTAVIAENGSDVNEGDPILILDSASLLAEKELIEKQLVLLDAEQAAAAAERQLCLSAISGLTEERAELSALLPALSVKAETDGFVLTVAVNERDRVERGDTIVELANDASLELTQYFSYAYAASIFEGMKMYVSVIYDTSETPVLYTGSVTAISYADHFDADGVKCFAVTAVIDPGIHSSKAPSELSAQMYFQNDRGIKIYPIDAGFAALSYHSIRTVTAPADGEISTLRLTAGEEIGADELLFELDAAEYETKIANVDSLLSAAVDKLAEADAAVSAANAKLEALNERLDELSAVSDVNPLVTAAASGTLIYLSELSAGYTPKSGESLFLICGAGTPLIRFKPDDGFSLDAVLPDAAPDHDFSNETIILRSYSLDFSAEFKASPLCVTADGELILIPSAYPAKDIGEFECSLSK